MAKNPIKIYARLKRDHSSNPDPIFYQVCKTDENDMIIFRLNNNKADIVNNKQRSHRYRFDKIFEQDASQAEMFDSIAKPVVKSVLSGYNGTIFAYGQTGSGKTYAITGSSKNYNGRGIIPRSIEEIFSIIEQDRDVNSIRISYLEIYNEIGYDLLNPKQQVSSLEELPKIMLMEDGKGESHLRNLTMKTVTTKHEAMRLLYLGDTNRTMAETPMNAYSSRSHCIFTISITCKNRKTGKIRRSKLNLVDLAGSERIKKSNISGTTLNEAKHINLSLHYLEQVVTALSQKRIHIPFRNSMLTYMLRDSLSGNCLTVLIATLAIARKNIEETLATCRFSQRVADVCLQAIANVEVDPQQEIEFLKKEIDDLQQQIAQQTKFMVSKELTDEEKEHWNVLINNYVNSLEEDMYLTNYDVRHIQYGFQRFKETVKEQEKQKLMLKVDINEKEKEIKNLQNLLREDSPKTICKPSPIECNKENVPPAHPSYSFSPSQAEDFKMFIENPQNTTELDFYKQSIEDMYKIATNLNAVVEQCQKNIVSIKSKLEHNQSESMLNEIDSKLMNQQTIYLGSLEQLQTLKTKSSYLKVKWELARNDVLQNFIKWCNTVHKGDFVQTQDVDARLKELISLKNSVMQNVSKMNLNFKSKAGSNEPENKYNVILNNPTPSLASSFNHLDNFYSCNTNVIQLEPERPYSRESKKHQPRKSVMSVDSSSEFSVEKRAILEEIRRKLEPDYDRFDKKDLKAVNPSSKTVCYYSATYPCVTSSSMVFEEPRQLDKIIETREEEFVLKTYEDSLQSLQVRNQQERQFYDPNICNNRCYSLYNGTIQSESGFRMNLKEKCDSVKKRVSGTLDEEFSLTTSYIESRQPKCLESDGSDSDSYKTALVKQTSSDDQTPILANKADVGVFTSDAHRPHHLPYVYNSLFCPNDSPQFMEVVKTVTLTGDFEVDIEIIKFYRAKFNLLHPKYS